MNEPAAKSSTASWSRARRVLAVRLDNLGDVLMTTPALAALRDSAPDGHLTLLTSPSGARLAGHLPMVDDCIAFDAPWVKSDAGDPSPGASEMALVAQLRERQFDAAAIFTVCTQSALPAALLCRLAGIPLRLAHSRENPYRLLTHWVREADEPFAAARHEVQRQLDLVRAVGLGQGHDERLQLRYGVDEALSMCAKFTDAGGDPLRPYFVVHPGASAPSRRYPGERFGVAAREIVESSGYQPVLCGSAAERALVDEVRAEIGAGCVDLGGSLSLGELAALVAGAQVILCNNSAPAHMASALGCPVVVLYALTNPQHTPWRAASRVLSHDVPCRNCLRSVCPQAHHACLDEIAPHDVAAAAAALLGPPPGVPRRIGPYAAGFAR